MNTLYDANATRAMMRGKSHRNRVAPRVRNTEPALVDGLPEVATEFAELDTGCRIETIESPTDPAKALLAIYESGEVRLGERFELGGRVFVPKARNAGIFSRVRLPKGVAPYESVRSLVTGTSALLLACLDIDPMLAQLVSFFIMSSWFPEKLPVAPYLALVGMPRSGKTTMLRLLAMLCRHGILVTDISSAALYQVYEQATPTLLIDETSTAADQKKLFHLLRSGSTPGSVALRKDSSFNAFGPKVFAWTELPNDRALITRCIVIPMHETDRTDLNRLTDPRIQLATEDLQKQFLQFRLERLGASLRVEGVDPVCSRNRDLYEALAFPITDDGELCQALALILSKQEQFTREPLSIRQVGVLSVLARAAHVPEHSMLLVGEVTTFANTMLAAQGECIKLTPHAVGNILTSFGIQSQKRTNKGWLLEFDQVLRRKIHLLVKRYGADGNLATFMFNASAKCKSCKDLHLYDREGGAPGEATQARVTP